MQPAGQRAIVRQAPRLARQVNKHRLGHVLGQVAVAVHHPERGGIDEINVPRHQLAEG